CVGPEFVRLRHIHDRAPHSDSASWRVTEALRWLDEVLDAPPRDPDQAGADGPLHAGPRVEYIPGESPGDRGRPGMSRTGRTDDLVWTRHSWWSDVELPGHPRGKLWFDIAVERPAIAAARRRAVALAGSLVLRTERLDLDSLDLHQQVLAVERSELE